MINFQNKAPKLLVIGDLMIDQYLWGSCERISPEAPVQIINVTKESEVLGGAGNVVNNLKKLGAQVDVLGVVGDCKVSTELKHLLSEIGVDTQYLIKQKNRIVSKKSRIIASQQQVVRYDRESNDDIEVNGVDQSVYFEYCSDEVTNLLQGRSKDDEGSDFEFCICLLTCLLLVGLIA